MNSTFESASVGYCTNVHAGVDLHSIQANLSNYAVGVRERLQRGRPLGVGLWIPAQASAELVRVGITGFADFLRAHELDAFTINGFPYDNFHQPIVKHRVYLPGWWDHRRLAYTRDLATILATLQPAEQSWGSISTLPVGWPANPCDPAAPDVQTGLSEAGQSLRQMADYLSELEARTGRRIALAIEPEPGCMLDTSDDIVAFFEAQFPDQHHRRYLTVCHDVCHAAVMMEQQSAVLRKYADAGISIGKVQVSSAVVVDWTPLSEERRRNAIAQLADFAEDRYLHQTGRLSKSGQFSLVNDLPELLAEVPERGDPIGGDQRWVIHFHVPIFLEQFGELSTSRAEIVECLRTLADPSVSVEFSGHLEIETYAWTVLPAAMRQHGLADDIAEEFRWLGQVLVEIGCAND